MADGAWVNPTREVLQRAMTGRVVDPGAILNLDIATLTVDGDKPSTEAIAAWVEANSKPRRDMPTTSLSGGVAGGRELFEARRLSAGGRRASTGNVKAGQDLHATRGTKRSAFDV